MNSVKIATILVNYNGYEDTVECIESLKCSTIPTDIIVVDNNSKNNDIDNIKSIYEDTILIKSTENLGFAGGNNLGITYALDKKYDYIILLNNDTVIDSKMIEILTKQCSDDCVTVPVMFYYNNKDYIWYAGGEIIRSKALTTHTFYNKSINEVKNEIHEKYCTFATGCCICIAAKTIEKVGLLSEEYFMYAEDLDYSIRLALNDVKINFLPDAKLWHKVSKSTGGNESDYSIYYNIRNNFYIHKKYNEFYSGISRIYFGMIMFRHYIKKALLGKSSLMPFIRGLIDSNKSLLGKSNRY